jgi:hypothetical protein
MDRYLTMKRGQYQEIKKELNVRIRETEPLEIVLERPEWSLQ